MSVPALVEELLDLTLQQATLSRRISHVRTAVEVQARQITDATGSAPRWKLAAGQVRIDGHTSDDTPVPDVVDSEAFTSWCAQNHPDETTAQITIPAAKLTDALEVLAMVLGLEPDRATVTVNGAWAKRLLSDVQLVDLHENAEGDLPDDRWLVVDKAGTAVPGLGARVPVSSPRLVVAVDKTRKAAAEVNVDETWAADQATSAAAAADDAA